MTDTSRDSALLPWRVAVALAGTQVVHWGSLFYAFSVLMPAMTAELGWPREAVVGAFSAALVSEAVAALGVGILLDRLGARVVMVTGSMMAGLGLWLAGQVESLWQLYAVWIGIGFVMTATMYQSAFAAVTAAFGAQAARRGIAIVVFAGGLSSTIFWPLTGVLVEAFGWRDTCALLAVINALCALPHVMLPSRQPRSCQGTANSTQDAAADAGLRQATRQLRFWGLAFVYAVVGMATSAVAVHLVPLLHERGADASATFVASLFGAAQLAGRVLEFAAGRRWSLRAVGLAALAALPAAFLGLAASATPLLLAGFVAMYGAANGILTIVRGALPSRMFGTAHYGAVSGALTACAAFARAAGPIAVAWLWDLNDSYVLPMSALGLLALSALLAFSLAARRC